MQTKYRKIIRFKKLPSLQFSCTSIFGIDNSQLVLHNLNISLRFSANSNRHLYESEMVFQHINKLRKMNTFILN